MRFVCVCTLVLLFVGPFTVVSGNTTKGKFWWLFPRFDEHSPDHQVESGSELYDGNSILISDNETVSSDGDDGTTDLDAEYESDQEDLGSGSASSASEVVDPIQPDDQPSSQMNRDEDGLVWNADQETVARKFDDTSIDSEQIAGDTDSEQDADVIISGVDGDKNETVADAERGRLSVDQDEPTREASGEQVSQGNIDEDTAESNLTVDEEVSDVLIIDYQSEEKIEPVESDVDSSELTPRRVALNDEAVESDDADDSDIAGVGPDVQSVDTDVDTLANVETGDASENASVEDDIKSSEEIDEEKDLTENEKEVIDEAGLAELEKMIKGNDGKKDDPVEPAIDDDSSEEDDEVVNVDQPIESVKDSLDSSQENDAVREQSSEVGDVDPSEVVVEDTPPETNAEEENKLPDDDSSSIEDDVGPSEAIESEANVEEEIDNKLTEDDSSLTENGQNGTNQSLSSRKSKPPGGQTADETLHWVDDPVEKEAAVKEEFANATSVDTDRPSIEVAQLCNFDLAFLSLAVMPSTVTEEPGVDSLLLCKISTTNQTVPIPPFRLHWIFDKLVCPRGSEDVEGKSSPCTGDLTSVESQGIVNTTLELPYELLKLNRTQAGAYTCRVEILGCPTLTLTSESVLVKVYDKPNYSVHMAIISGTCVILFIIVVGLFYYASKVASKSRNRYQELLSSTDIQYHPTKVLELPNSVYNPTTTTAKFIRMSASSYSSKSSFTSNEIEEA